MVAICRLVQKAGCRKWSRELGRASWKQIEERMAIYGTLVHRAHNTWKDKIDGILPSSGQSCVL
jgi:hypothetical protein